MKLGVLLAAMRRESRGSSGRLVFLTACLALGVMAIVGVAALSAALREGVRGQSRKLLTADLVVDGRVLGGVSRVPETLDAMMAELAPGAERADTWELASMVAAASDTGFGRSQLSNLKVVRGRFPLHGALELEPPRPLEALLADGGVVAEPELIRVLGVELGDTLLVGGVPLTLRGVVLDEPDRLDFSLTLGPRLFLAKADLDRGSLLGFGSRVRHRALFRLPEPDADVRALKAQLEARLAEHPGVDVETHAEARPQLRRGIDRFERMLGLVALLSLLLGGTGVAQIVRAWVASRTRAFATLRCLGLRPRELLLMALGHVGALALLGSLLGALAGLSLPWLLSRALPELLPPDLVAVWQPAALLRGLGLGVGVALLFAGPPLAALWRVSPALVLRADAQPLPAPRGVLAGCWGALLAGLFFVAWAQSERVEYAAGFTAGLLVLTLLLHGGAGLLMRLSARLPRERISPYLRNGVAALGRPGAGTRGALVALGLGVLVVLTMELVGSRLAAELRGSLPEDAPTAFLLDIQPDQWDGVRDVLTDGGARHVNAAPLLMARFEAIDGRPVDEILEERGELAGDGDRDRGGRGGRGSWALRGEKRVTWMEELPDDNEVVAGALWSDPARDEVSLEVDYAEEIGAQLGTVLTLDVAGIPIELLVTSLRTVEWRSFGINFFMVVEPGVLDRAPHARLATARLDEGDEDTLSAPIQDHLAVSHPNVTLIDVRRILEKLATMLDRLATGVRALGLFTVFTGLAVLAGAVSAHGLRRRREAALLKTLGVTRAGVATLLGVEYGLLGFVAGALGACGALVLAAVTLDEMELTPTVPWLWILGAAALTALLAALAGLLSSARALSAPPVESLRG